jgi:hypothetical protein
LHRSNAGIETIGERTGRMHLIDPTEFAELYDPNDPVSMCDQLGVRMEELELVRKRLGFPPFQYQREREKQAYFSKKEGIQSEYIPKSIHTKCCAGFGRTKSLSDFGVTRRYSKTYPKSQCKKCLAEKQRSRNSQYYRDNKDKFLAYYRANKDTINSKRRHRYAQKTCGKQ